MKLKRLQGVYWKLDSELGFVCTEVISIPSDKASFLVAFLLAICGILDKTTVVSYLTTQLACNFET